MSDLTIDLSSSQSERKANVWEKQTQDVANASESATNARDIGYVRNNSYRANVVSALTEGDTEDWFSFNVQTKGNLRITARAATKNEADSKLSVIEQYAKDLKDEDVVIEVYKAASYGRTEKIASSANEKDKEMYDTFMSLMKGEYKIEQTGNFYVRVIRAEGTSTKDDREYIIQAQMGDEVKHDYQTTETPTDQSPAAQLDALLAKAESLSTEPDVANLLGDMLTNGYNNIAKWQYGKHEKTLIDLLG